MTNTNMTNEAVNLSTEKHGPPFVQFDGKGMPIYYRNVNGNGIRLEYDSISRLVGLQTNDYKWSVNDDDLVVRYVRKIEENDLPCFIEFDDGVTYDEIVKACRDRGLDALEFVQTNPHRFYVGYAEDILDLKKAFTSK